MTNTPHAEEPRRNQMRIAVEWMRNRNWESVLGEQSLLKSAAAAGVLGLILCIWLGLSWFYRSVFARPVAGQPAAAEVKLTQAHPAKTNRTVRRESKSQVQPLVAQNNLAPEGHTGEEAIDPFAVPILGKNSTKMAAQETALALVPISKEVQQEVTSETQDEMPVLEREPRAKVFKVKRDKSLDVKPKAEVIEKNPEELAVAVAPEVEIKAVVQDAEVRESQVQEPEVKETPLNSSPREQSASVDDKPAVEQPIVDTALLQDPIVVIEEKPRTTEGRDQTSAVRPDGVEDAFGTPSRVVSEKIERGQIEPTPEAAPVVKRAAEVTPSPNSPVVENLLLAESPVVEKTTEAPQVVVPRESDLPARPRDDDEDRFGGNPSSEKPLTASSEPSEQPVKTVSPQPAVVEQPFEKPVEIVPTGTPAETNSPVKNADEETFGVSTAEQKPLISTAPQSPPATKELPAQSATAQPEQPVETPRVVEPAVPAAPTTSPTRNDEDRFGTAPATETPFIEQSTGNKATVEKPVLEKPDVEKPATEPARETPAEKQAAPASQSAAAPGTPISEAARPQPEKPRSEPDAELPARPVIREQAFDSDPAEPVRQPRRIVSPVSGEQRPPLTEPVATIRRESPPQIDFELTAPLNAAAGAKFPIGFKVTNIGSSDIENLIFTIQLPPALQHRAGAAVEYRIPRLPPGTSKTAEMHVLATTPELALIRARMTSGEFRLATSDRQIQIRGEAGPLSSCRPRILQTGGMNCTDWLPMGDWDFNCGPRR